MIRNMLDIVPKLSKKEKHVLMSAIRFETKKYSKMPHDLNLLPFVNRRIARNALLRGRNGWIGHFLGKAYADLYEKLK